jgi:hypothetical protein
MNRTSWHLVKRLTGGEMGNYHMTTFKQAYISIDPRVYPHAGTAVEPPDAQVPGVSPVCEGLGMEEPSAADRAMLLSNLVKTASPPVVNLLTQLDHAPHHPPQTFCRDANVIEWITNRDMAPAYAAHLSTSARDTLYHPSPQEVHQERAEREETAATSANFRPITGKFAAQAQKLIEGCRGVRWGSSFLLLSVAGKFGSLRGKLP